MSRKPESWNNKFVVSPGCWNWARGKDLDGYGAYRINGIQKKAHRYSYELYVGPIPDGLVVMHSCDNPSCVNPDHLSLGTNAGNQADKVKKGRQAIGQRVGSSRLNESQIIDIYTSNDPTNVLLKRYGLSVSHFNRIVNGVVWGHVTKSLIPGIRKKIPQVGSNNPNWNGGSSIRGELNMNARLTSKQVAEIRAEYKPRIVTRANLAMKYGVSTGTIDNIICGKTWRVQENGGIAFVARGADDVCNELLAARAAGLMDKGVE